MSTAGLDPDPAYGEVDLTTCDLEPIHQIGRIQSFGVLLALSNDWIVAHASRNCEALTGLSAEALIGTSARAIFRAEALHEVGGRLQILVGPDSIERIFDIDLRGDGLLYDVALHRSGRYHVLEIEAGDPMRKRDYVSYVRPMIDRMRTASSIDSLCNLAARQLRGLTGFDRVMVYRFAAGGAGSVVAESTALGIESFLGQHFPAADIPRQARALYQRNVLRIISDVNDPTVPVLPPRNADGVPLDLSMSGLRAVSPIHIEYLRNMGVGASMSISILRNGELWGLFALHHYAPRQLSYAVRTAAELFGEFFSYILDQAEANARAERQQRAGRLHDEIMARVASGSSLLDAFAEFSDSIERAIPCDGIVGWVNGEFMSRGLTPTREEFEPLARFLNTTGASRVWATDALPEAFPAAAAYVARCAGLLAIPVSRAPRDFIVLFRREVIQTVNWAGNPEKQHEPGPLGDRLTPRKSFELWAEERRGRSLPWDEEQRGAAEALRVTLIEVVLQLADATARERDKAAQRQQLLIGELNHRVRNILTLVRGIVAQSRDRADTIDAYAEVIGARIHALARAHDHVTATNVAPLSLHALVRAECQAFLGEAGGRLRFSGRDATVTPAAYTPLALVIHELMTNSGKYGALSVPGGAIHVATGERADGALSFEWRESDGPPVQIPSRRGFGSTIIERSIPHELGGTAELDYRADGLLARFIVPPGHVAGFAHTNVAPASAPASSGAPAPRLHGRALVVEDNMIIAFEVEDALIGLGCESCDVAGTVAQAEALVRAHDYAVAMLDINLGSETSRPVAEMLAARGVPFVFASGYGELPWSDVAFPAVPVVNKPFDRGEFHRALRSIGLG